MRRRRRNVLPSDPATVDAASLKGLLWFPRRIFFIFFIFLFPFLASSLAALYSCKAVGAALLFYYSFRPPRRKTIFATRKDMKKTRQPPPPARPGSMTNLHTHTRARAAFVCSFAGNGNLTSILTHFFSFLLLILFHNLFIGSLTLPQEFAHHNNNT